MISEQVRIGVCPKINFLQYRIDLEKNGYKVISTKEDEAAGNVIFEYKKIHDLTIPMFSQ